MAIQTEDFDFIRQLVYSESGIVLAPGKEYLVENRLASIVDERDLEGLEALTDRLRRGALSLIDDVVDALTTNETSFFRDIHPFHALRDNILPQLIDRRRPTRRLNIWCGASSSGQEPLSLAMLIKEDFPELERWDLKILATDISDTMLERCRSGEYSQFEVSRGLPLPLLCKYFEKKGKHWKVRDEIHGLIDFQKLNLLTGVPRMPPVDLIMIRNVLIYFDQSTKQSIFERMHIAMASDACLLLGSTEIPTKELFTRVPCARTSYYVKAS